MRGTMSESAKAAGRKAITKMLEMGMPIVEGAHPLDFRLSVASVLGAIGSKGKGEDQFSDAFGFIMGYLSAATDEEITEIMRESKARSN